RLIGHYRSAQEWLRAHATPLTVDAQLRRAAETSGTDEEEIRRCVIHWMEKAPASVLPFFVRRKLRRRIETWSRLGVPMAIYSDYPATWKLASLGMGGFIPHCVCSTDPDVMALKPSRRGFEVAAQKIGLVPADVAYVGDREDVDGVGARSAGMLSVILP